MSFFTLLKLHTAMTRALVVITLAAVIAICSVAHTRTPVKKNALQAMVQGNPKIQELLRASAMNGIALQQAAGGWVSAVVDYVKENVSITPEGITIKIPLVDEV